MSDRLREDRRPLPLQLVERLRVLIRDEGLQPGERLPSESELAARFGAARGSVREALKLLEQDGIVDVRHGLGRFVSPSGGLVVDRPVTVFESATDMLRSRGFEPTTKVLGAEAAKPTEEEATALGVDADTPVVRLRRLRSHGGKLLIYSIATFPAAVLGGEDPRPEEFAGSLTDWLGEHGHRLDSSAAQLRATSLPEDVARLREAKGKAEWLLITERCVDDEGRLFLFSQDYHRGDAFTFSVLRRRDS